MRISYRTLATRHPKSVLIENKQKFIEASVLRINYLGNSFSKSILMNFILPEEIGKFKGWGYKDVYSVVTTPIDSFLFHLF